MPLLPRIGPMEETRFDRKTFFEKVTVSRLIKPGDISKKMLRKGYSVLWDFSWIENYKLKCVPKNFTNSQKNACAEVSF